MEFLLMVIAIVHEDCVVVLETESHPPVAVDSNRPVACELSLERVKIHPGRFMAIGFFAESKVAN